MKKLKILILTAILSAGVFSSCSEDKLRDSIFDTTPATYTGFDLWLYENFVQQYNIEVKYKWEDSESVFSKKLTPPSLEGSEMMARILKHYWVEAYDEVTGSVDFMRTYCPRVMFFVGSYALNNDGSVTLGTAEGGMKIVLYELNYLKERFDRFNLDEMNERYFKTMHHEFAHILHQTKNYPTEFNNISMGKYNQSAWINFTDAQVWPSGFVTAYGSSEPREDFVEVIANYLVKSDAWWNNMIANAGTEGAAAINKKLEICTNWMMTDWGIDLKALQSIIRRRGAELQTLLNDE